jgi:phosphoglycolate phosphatase-like HAD superfamily hydrolase
MMRTQAIVFDMDGVLRKLASLGLLLPTLEVRYMRSTQAHFEPEEHSECLATTRRRSFQAERQNQQLWYVQELHTSNAKFILQNGIEGSK